MQRSSDLYFEEIRDQFDNWASPYDTQQRFELIKKLLPKLSCEMNCLEIGCATGQISEKILPLVKNLTVSDISGVLAEHTGNRLNVNWLKQDACKLHRNENTFDIVISSECIEHTYNPKQALAAMVKVVRDSGYIIVTSPNKLWFPVLWAAEKLNLRKFQGNENWLFPKTAARILMDHGVTDIVIGGCHILPFQIPLSQRVLPFFDRFHRILYPLMINYGIRGQVRKAKD